MKETRKPNNAIHRTPTGVTLRAWSLRSRHGSRHGQAPVIADVGEEIMSRRTSIALSGVALGVGIAVLFFKSLSIAYCELTGTPQTWLKRSSPLRSPIRDVWRQWDAGGVADSDAVKTIAEIINRELHVGSSDEEVRKHIRSHFERVSFHPMGARKELAYHENACGATYPHKDALLKFCYISDKNEFIRAEIHMRRFKGSDMHYIALNSDSGHPILIDHRATSAEQAGTDQPASRSESKPEGDDKPQPESEARLRQRIAGLGRYPALDRRRKPHEPNRSFL